MTKTPVGGAVYVNILVALDVLEHPENYADVRANPNAVAGRSRGSSGEAKTSSNPRSPYYIGNSVNEANNRDDVTYAKNNGPAPPSKLKDGDTVKTPDTHPDEFIKNKDGSYTHKKTGWTASKDKSGHGGEHWDMAPSRGSGHINVGPDGNIFGGSMK